MDDIYIYIAPLPNTVNECVTPCPDGYTVYINERLSRSEQQAACIHAVTHIVGNDFDKSDVQDIERFMK